MIGDEMTLNQVRARIATTLDNWEARRDRRALFLTLYSLAMDGVYDAACRDVFADPLWVLRTASQLAEHYFVTVTPDDDDLSGVTPPAWRVAHEHPPLGGKRSSTQWIALGVNAQLSNDLPQALALTMRQDWPVRDARVRWRREDLRRLAGLIAEAASCAGDALAPRPKLSSSSVLHRIVTAWCDDAWSVGMTLCTTVNTAWWTAVCEEIECTALRRAHLLACDIDGAASLLLEPARSLDRTFPTTHEPSGCRLTAPVPTWGTPAPATFPDR